MPEEREWHVIFVDDDPGIIHLYEIGLSKFSNTEARNRYTVTVFEDAASAITYSEKPRIAKRRLWIIDSMMPACKLDEAEPRSETVHGLLTGVGVIRAIRRKLSTPGLDVFVVLTHQRGDDVAEALNDPSVRVLEKNKYPPRKFAQELDGIILSP